MPNFRDPYDRWGEFEPTDLNVEFLLVNARLLVACMNGILRLTSPGDKVVMPGISEFEIRRLMKNDLA